MRESTIFSIFSILVGVVLLVLALYMKQNGLLMGVAGITGMMICGIGIGIVIPIRPGGSCPVCGGKLDRTGHCLMCEHQISPRTISRRFWRVRP